MGTAIRFTKPKYLTLPDLTPCSFFNVLYSSPCMVCVSLQCSQPVWSFTFICLSRMFSPGWLTWWIPSLLWILTRNIPSAKGTGLITFVITGTKYLTKKQHKTGRVHFCLPGVSHMMAGRARRKEQRLITLCLPSRNERERYECKHSARLVFFILSGTPTSWMVLPTFQTDLLSSVKFWEYPLIDMARSRSHWWV